MSASFISLTLVLLTPLVCIAGGLIIITLFYRSVFVPARKKAIVERMGQFSRVLNPGWHMLMPFESIRAFRWTYIGQNGETVTQHERYVSTETNSMDPPPTECITRDNALVEVDGRVMYKITNLEAAAYDTDDVLNLLYTFVQQATKQVVAETTMQALHGHDNVIGDRIVALVNERLAPKADGKGKERGIVCESFAIQNLGFDDAVLKKNQEIGAETRQHELNKARKVAEHETLMEVMEMERVKAAMTQQAAYKAKEATLQLQELEATADAKRKATAWRVMMSAGFTVPDIIRLESIAALRETSAHCATRLVIAPHDFLANISRPEARQMLMIPGYADASAKNHDNDDNGTGNEEYEKFIERNE